MLHLAVRLVLAAVLLGAAAAKLRRPRESGAGPGRPARAGPERTRGRSRSRRRRRRGPLAAGVALGSDVAAVAAAVFLFAGAALLARALAAGRGGAPCGCFGARSRVSRARVARAALLGLAFAALPFLPRSDPSAETWLAVGLVAALLGVAALGVAVLALAREVGMLRLAVGPQGALEIPEEGPPLGSDSGLAAHLDPRVDGADVPLALAVFSSEGCALCRRLAPGIAALGRHPHVSLLELDEVRDAGHWRRLAVPGSPYALALDADGRVLAKGTFNSLAQLESVLAAGERRLGEPARPVPDRPSVTEDLALSTSRRGLLARVGAALLGAAGGSVVKAVVAPGEADAYHFCGHIYTTDSCPHPTGLPRIDSRGMPLRAKDGKRVDNTGRIVDREGYPIDEAQPPPARPRRQPAAARAAHADLRAGRPALRHPAPGSTAPGTAAAAARCASSSTAARTRASGSTATPP